MAIGMKLRYSKSLMARSSSGFDSPCFRLHQLTLGRLLLLLLLLLFRLRSWDDGDTSDTVKNPEHVRPREGTERTKQTRARAVEEQEHEVDMEATRVTRRRSKLKAHTSTKEGGEASDKQIEADMSPFAIGLKVAGEEEDAMGLC